MTTTPPLNDLPKINTVCVGLDKNQDDIGLRDGWNYGLRFSSWNFHQKVEGFVWPLAGPFIPAESFGWVGEWGYMIGLPLFPHGSDWVITHGISSRFATEMIADVFFSKKYFPSSYKQGLLSPIFLPLGVYHRCSWIASSWGGGSEGGRGGLNAPVHCWFSRHRFPFCSYGASFVRKCDDIVSSPTKKMLLIRIPRKTLSVPSITVRPSIVVDTCVCVTSEG